MSYADAQNLSLSFKTTNWLIKKLAKDLDHAGSVRQPPFPGNCFNWVLGHILAGRNEVLNYLEVSPIWGDDELALYKTGSPSISGQEDAIPLSDLMETLELSQERIMSTLVTIPAEQWDKIVSTRFGDRPVGQHVGGLHWHETYHTGQLELLRELALMEE
jgi:hypothetical protein